MAFTEFHLNIFSHMLPLIKSRPIELVTLGYQDALITCQQVEKYFGSDLIANPVYRSDSEEILKRHNLPAKGVDGVLETGYLMRLLGVKMTAIDVAEIRGGERFCDLNEPIEDELFNAYDIVLDGGTIEHCFNIGQAMKNILAMAKVGGYIVHSNPISMINHGFYNLNPTFYADFYIDNGHSLAAPIYLQSGQHMSEIYSAKLDLYMRTKVPQESGIVAVAQKLNVNAPKWPVQTKYKKMAAGVSSL